MPLSLYALEKYVSQGFSNLKKLNIKSVESEFPDRDSWYENFVLNLVFANHIEPDREPLAYVSIRRAQAAISNWEIICQIAPNIGPRNIPAHFKALESVENLIAALWQAVEFARKAVEINVFEKGDGTEYERLNNIYNVSRHFDPESLPEGHLHAIWLREDGITCLGDQRVEWKINFDELREILLMVCLVANAIANNERSEQDKVAA